MAIYPDDTLCPRGNPLCACHQLGHRTPTPPAVTITIAGGVATVTRIDAGLVVTVNDKDRDTTRTLDDWDGYPYVLPTGSVVAA